MVDRTTCWTNHSAPAHLANFIEQIVLPKKVSPVFIRTEYLNRDLSASQLAGELGVSKQKVLVRLRDQGIHRTLKGRSASNYRFSNPPHGFQVKDSKLVSLPREMKMARSGAKWTQSTVRPVHKRWTGKL